MKIDARRAAAFLRDPGPTRIVLLHGEDEGAIRLAAEALARTVLGAAPDPFRLSMLMPGEHDRLSEEAGAIAMLGGRRVVRVRNAADSLLPSVQAVAAAPGDTLVVIEAPGLGNRSKLVASVQAMPEAAALVFYPEDPEQLRATVARALQSAGVRADPDALDWLRDHLGGDAAQIQNEIEKLVLYAGETNRLTLEDVLACVGDAAAVSLDEAAFATVAGDTPAADRALERALAEGTSPVALLRVLLGQFTRLHLARGRVEAGIGAADAIKSLRPPVFWKRERAMVAAVGAWTMPRLSAALDDIRHAELACKQTGAPDLAIVRHLVFALARSRTRR